MNIYVYIETNFVFELVFQQEQFASCEQILQLCQSKQIKLVIPAYSLAEPHEKLTRQAKERKKLQELLNQELGQLSRTQSYTNRIKNIQNLTSLLVQSNQEERDRFVEYRNQFLKNTEIIDLTADVIKDAAAYENIYALSPQDALIYSSVITHLRNNKPKIACFLNKNSKDFDNPDIVDELKKFNCRIIPRFDHGYNFMRSQIK